MAETKSTTVYISGEEVEIITTNLKGNEGVSDFVHNAVNELVDKRRTEKGMVKDNGVSQ